MKIKPRAYSMACASYEIVYKCGNKDCNFRFNMANKDWRYCPKCGAEIDWGVLAKANEEWKQLFLAIDEVEKTKMLSAIDKYNKSITDGCQYEMQKTEATKEAIIMSNIGYYLGTGWSQEELIKKAFFTQEQINKYLEQRKR